MLKNIITSFLLILILSFFFINKAEAIYNDSIVGTYEEELSKFPNEYKIEIEKLHKIYPKAIFVAQDNFFDWDKKKEVEVDFERMVASEYTTNGRSLIYHTFDDGYKSSDSWAYDFYENKYATKFSGSAWNAAHKQTIRYYLDSRNFLDNVNIFMFESQYFKDYHTKEGVEKILSGTFMANKICEGSNRINEKGIEIKLTYADVIMEAGKKNNISPYMLASRLRQEQGTKGTSSLISGTYSGYEGYYNYFNIKASGSTDKQVILNGLKNAKIQGWTSPYLSIIGGAKFIYQEYIGVNDQYEVKGQMTNFLQKWDPYGYNLGGHQYMQNITAPITEAQSTYESYSKTKNDEVYPSCLTMNDYRCFNYVFYIPIFSNMPSTPATLPKKGNPNNYLKEIKVNGATIGTIENYKSGVETYSINVNPSSTMVNIDYIKPNKAPSIVEGDGQINLTNDQQKINLIVTAQNGDKKNYSIIVNRNNNANLLVSEIISGVGLKSDGTNISGVKVGTTSQDFIDKISKISSSAIVSIEKNSNNKTDNLATGDKITIKSGSEIKVYNVVIYGDVNGDGKILATDYVKIKNHIMGNSLLTGVYKMAADVNKDNSVKATDYVFVKNSIMGIYEIGQ